MAEAKMRRPTGASRQSRGGQKAGGHALSMDLAKARSLEYLKAGYTRAEAMAKVGRSVKTYENWRKTDSEYRLAADVATSTRNIDTSTREGARSAAKAMGFAEWRQKYLDLPTYWHQMQWIDLIEGRDPRDLHEAQTYEPGRRKNRIVINCPPFHAKSMTISMDYVTYRICINPGVRVIIISKTQGMAKKFLSKIKMNLTHPRYAALIKDFAPEGGFEQTAEQWAADSITLSIADRDGVEKDPTVQALGIGGQVYGARADLIIVDDAVTLANANEWEKQLDWISQEVGSRPGPSGKILVIGTRVSPNDLYFQLRNPDNYNSGNSPWTYLTQPAVLVEEGEPGQWETLWPRATRSWWQEDDGNGECDCGIPECEAGYGDGSFPRWDGVHLAPLRENEARWQLVFMQSAVTGNAVFPNYAIQEATNKGRRAGKDGGMYSVPEGCYVIGSLDPATSGFAAMIVGGIDRRTNKRYLYDAWNIKHPTPQELKNRIKAVTIEYGVHEWRIEKTGLLTMFTQDFELNQWLMARGVRLTTHYTGKNKFDVAFGVQSMQNLFGSWAVTHEGDRKLIADPILEIPRHEGDIATLVHQLSIWTPELDPKKTPCDLVMALWFFEVGARDLVKVGSRPTKRHMSGLSPMRDKKKAAVYDLSEFRQRAVV